MTSPSVEEQLFWVRAKSGRNYHVRKGVPVRTTVGGYWLLSMAYQGDPDYYSTALCGAHPVCWLAGYREAKPRDDRPVNQCATCRAKLEEASDG